MAKLKPKKLILPGDRTTKQPVMAFCRNVQCIEEGKRFEFEVQHADVTCPKCGATEHPMIGLLSLIHLLIRNPAGQILGSGGVRYQLACDQSRSHIATLTNDEAGSDQLQAANCPGCLKFAAEKKIQDSQGLVVTG